MKSWSLKIATSDYNDDDDNNNDNDYGLMIIIIRQLLLSLLLLLLLLFMIKNDSCKNSEDVSDDPNNINVNRLKLL